MRKPFVLLLVFVMIAALVACGTNESKPLTPTETSNKNAPETTQAAEETIFAIIEAKNCFHDAGFIELIAGVEESSEYTFTAENSDAVEWSVYILDEAFEEGFRYIRQIAQPVLLGDGTILIEKGQYVYVYCSANEFTTGAVDENAKLKVTVK